MMPLQYPPDTLIMCVLVGGDAHGRSYAKTPADANGIKMATQPLMTRLSFGENMNEPSIAEAVVIWYEPFAELSFRGGFIRLFSVQVSGRDNPSVLMIADALRIAGVEKL